MRKIKNQVGIGLLLASLFLCPVATISLTNSTQEVVTTIVTRPKAPETVADIIMRSRETAPTTADRSDSKILGAGLLALAVIFAAGLILFMRSGSEFFRQMRLSRRKPRNRTTLPHQLTTAPPAPPLLEERGRYE